MRLLRLPLLICAGVLCGGAALSPSGRWVAHRDHPGIGNTPPLVVSRVGDGERRSIPDVSDFSWGNETLWYRKSGRKLYAYDPAADRLWSGAPKAARDLEIHSIAALDADDVAFLAFRMRGTPSDEVCVMERPSRRTRCRAIAVEHAELHPFSRNTFVLQQENELRFLSAATLTETGRRRIPAGRTLVTVARGRAGEMLIVTFDADDVLHFTISGRGQDAGFDVPPTDRCGMRGHTMFRYLAAEARFADDSWSVTVPKSWENEWAVFTVSRNGLSCASGFRHLP